MRYTEWTPGPAANRIHFNGHTRCIPALGDELPILAEWPLRDIVPY